MHIQLQYICLLVIAYFAFNVAKTIYSTISCGESISGTIHTVYDDYEYSLTISKKTDLTIDSCDSQRDIRVIVYDSVKNISYSVCPKGDSCGQCSDSWNEHYTLPQIEPNVYYIVVYTIDDPGPFQLNIGCSSSSSSPTNPPSSSSTLSTLSTSPTSKTGHF